ncbi:MAG: 2-oxoacid:acceptor oxidoreductase subunit alpha, partial [Clostridiaceae bacterium]|nr:2-oxoacid:acceptor oxidoreductase subunit alpha [Clostridiaceae bacterium]
QGYALITDEQAARGRDAIQPDPHEDEIAPDYSDWLILNGNNAIALGALAAGVQFYAAYPMSPSTSIMEHLASVMDQAGIVVEQAEDELAGINMAVGASYAGAVAMTGTSGGGYALKVEAIAMAGMQEIPVVVVDAMRPGPVTGLPTRTEQGDLNMAIFAGNGEYPKAVIAVKNHEDAFYQTARALHLAQKYQMPVILLTDQYLADGTATVPHFDLSKVTRVVAGNTAEEALAYKQDYVRGDTPSGEMTEKELAESEYKRYRLTENGISPRLIPGNPYAFVSADTDEHDEYGFITESAKVRVEQTDKRKRKMTTLIADDLQEPEQFGKAGSKVLLVGWGSLHGTLLEAADKFAARGVDVNILVFGDVWPLPLASLTEAAANAEHIINVEQNTDGQLGALIRRESGITMTHSLLKYDGRAISSDEVVERVLDIIGKE